LERAFAEPKPYTSTSRPLGRGALEAKLKPAASGDLLPRRENRQDHARERGAQGGAKRRKPTRTRRLERSREC